MDRSVDRGICLFPGNSPTQGSIALWDHPLFIRDPTVIVNRPSPCVTMAMTWIDDTGLFRPSSSTVRYRQGGPRQTAWSSSLIYLMAALLYN